MSLTTDAEIADAAIQGIREDQAEAFPVPDTGGEEHGNTPEQAAGARYVDVAALLDGGLPDPPAPVLLHRTDGHAIFYKAQVNLIFGDPESGKTLVAQAAMAEALRSGRRSLFVDIDHNGAQATICRFLDFGVSEEILRNPDLFRYVEPEDREHLHAVVADTKAWRPAVAVVDSVGELLPLLGLNSNSPDDFTTAHAKVLKPMALAGSAVLAIDHLPKSTESRASGPTGTAAKRRAVGGVSIRVTINEQFAPGKAGSAFLNVNKDRHGGLRRYCPTEGKEPSAGVFKLDSSNGDMVWEIQPPTGVEPDPTSAATPGDVAELDTLDPPPTSVRDVKTRLRWGSKRANDALNAWRSRRSPTVPGEQGTGQGNSVPVFPTPGVGNGEHPGEPDPCHCGRLPDRHRPGDWGPCVTCGTRIHRYGPNSRPRCQTCMEGTST